MGACITIKVKFRYGEKVELNKIHDLYKQFGMKPFYIDHSEDESISYDEAFKSNQNCFDNNIIFDKWQHYRISWKGGFLSYIDTMPVIDPLESIYSKEEWIMLPEEEVTDEVFAKVLSLVKAFYKLEFVSGITIEKEF